MWSQLSSLIAHAFFIMVSSISLCIQPVSMQGEGVHHAHHVLCAQCAPAYEYISIMHCTTCSFAILCLHVCTLYISHLLDKQTGQVRGAKHFLHTTTIFTIVITTNYKSYYKSTLWEHTAYKHATSSTLHCRRYSIINHTIQAYTQKDVQQVLDLHLTKYKSLRGHLMDKLYKHLCVIQTVCWFYNS